jgi:hypothetical protein
MLSNDDQKEPRRMRSSRWTVLGAVGVVAAAAAIAGGVAFAQADKAQERQVAPPAPTAPLSPDAARAYAQQLQREAGQAAAQLERDQAANPNPAPPEPSRPATPTPRTAVDAALKNAANVADASGTASAPTSTPDSARGTVPVEIATGVKLAVFTAVVSPTESGGSDYLPNDTLSVVQVHGKFTPRTPPPVAGQPAPEPISYPYLVVVTDEQTGKVREFSMDESPIALKRLSTDVAKATIPQK